MNRIFLATLGQRPEAITMALDALLPRYHFERIGILHMDIQHSGIAEAYTALMPRLSEDYEPPTLHHGLCYPNGESLIDITDQRSAEAYHRAILAILKQYRVEGWEIHLLVAGGRKAMTIYATLAAALVFGSNDRVWTILADEHLMQRGAFHVPAGMAQGIQLVNLPLLPSRLLRGVLAERDIDSLLAQNQDLKARFMESLTQEEIALIEMLQAHPYSGNLELGRYLTKAEKTVENQFRGIYKKLGNYFDVDVEDKRKRQVLLDVLAGRL